MKLILTHGAGSNKDAPLLVAIDEALTAKGVEVIRYNLPYRQKRPTGPPLRGTAEGDREGLRALIEQTPGRVLLGGHSYGGRQSSILASEHPGLVDGLLLLSYPLHPPRKPDDLRVAHLPKLQTKALFVHGTRDPFGTTGEMEQALKLIPSEPELLVLEGAGHELKIGAAEQIAEALLATFAKIV